MHFVDDTYVYSPSDLIAFLENEAVTWLDRYDQERPGELTRDEPSADERMMRDAGDDHERTFLSALSVEGRDVINLRNASNAYPATLVAMHEGRDVIYQARLEAEFFTGYADFLMRVDGSSELGTYHYEVWDTKLARSVKPYFAVQLCCYAEMLEGMQGRRPDRLGVVLGDGERRILRTADYFYYYGAVKADFLNQQRQFDAEYPPSFDGTSNYRHWSGHVAGILEDRDDLSLIANIRGSQVAKLIEAGIRSVRGLANATLGRMPELSAEAFTRLQAQARLQIASRGLGRPEYEVIHPSAEAPRTGLALLPPSSPSDIWFDIEGYPLAIGGLEYLLGVTYLGFGRVAFRDWWAHDPDQERRSFESFVHWAHARWQNDQTMHIYHYAPYETAALKRLMGRYACCEQEVDDLLRNAVFVDLYAVVRQGLRIGEPSYSLKYVEHLYAPRRTGSVISAGDSIVQYHQWRENPDGEDWRTSNILKCIRDYNEQDCISTKLLTDWLRGVQEASGISYLPIATGTDRRPCEATNARAQLAAQMLTKIPDDTSKESERWRVQGLLAHLLEFHRRANKPSWWLLFERASMTEQELISDPDCLGALERTKRRPEIEKKSLLYEYRFDFAQESKLRAGDGCRFAHDIDQHGSIHFIDYDRGLLALKLGAKRPAPPVRLGLIPDDIVNAKIIVDSIEATVREYVASGVLPPALRDFLHRRRPSLDGRNGPIVKAYEQLLDGCMRAALDMKGTTLCVQGPPGSGKTYAGGRMIAALLKAGKRVGVTSNSHRAICLLLKEAARAADEMGVGFTGAKAGCEDDDDMIHPSIEMLLGNPDVFKLDELPSLVGGTAWVFSRPEARSQFDYLFIDEAGQVSVANLVGMAPSATNIVLLGDQMQLNQPVQGCHPGESGCSTLEYFLQGAPTVSDDAGIFLPNTWRLRPELCSFISDAVYEGRLQPELITSDRSLRFDDDDCRYLTRRAGLLYVPVQHEGNTYECETESDVVCEIVAELLRQHVNVSPCPERRMTRDDILVVAPYNLQVRRLASLLPGVRVGTVDKFQGQEAPVVIFSMTASDGDASPRGIEFLFSKNRLNVAISRAQILAIIVASPKLIRTRCARLDQIALVNLFCRAAESSASDVMETKAVCVEM